MKKIYLFACATLLAFSGCTNEISEDGFVDKTNAISFSAYPTRTRAVTGDVANDNIIKDNFGVVGYSKNSIYLYKNTNQAVEQKWVANAENPNGGTWEYADLGDLKFWPNNAMDFYAYFPFSDGATFTAKNSDENNPTVDVMSIATTCTHDVLFAYAGNQNKTTRVPLTFHHAFAKIKGLTIEMPANGTLNKSKCQIEVKGVEFINTSTEGTIKVNNTGVASYEVATPNVTLTDDLSHLTSSPVTVNSTTTTGTLIDNKDTESDGYFFATNTTEVKNVVGTKKTMWDGQKTSLESGTITGKGLVCLKLTCKVWNGEDDNKYYYVGSDGTEDSNYGEIYIPLKGTGTINETTEQVATFDAGKRYIYNIVMKDNVGYTDAGDPILTPILFNVASVDKWGDVTVTITL